MVRPLTTSSATIFRAQSEERFARIEAALERLAEAQARTEVEFREYRERSEERLARIEATLDRLAEAQAQTEAQMRALAEAQAQTEAQMRALAEKQAQTEKVLQSLIATQQKFEERLQRLEIRVGQMDGDLLEIRYQERATSYFGRILRRLKVVSISDILDTLEERLSPDEVEELFNLDLLIRGRIRGSPGETGPEVWLAVEISALIDTEDVERALQRAILLRKAGYPAIPTVAGRNISPVAETVARREGVVIVQDGRSTLWQEAFAQWESNQA